MNASVVGHKCPYKWVNQLIIHLNQLISLKIFIHSGINQVTAFMDKPCNHSLNWIDSIKNADLFKKEFIVLMSQWITHSNKSDLFKNTDSVRIETAILFAGVIWSFTQPNRLMQKMVILSRLNQILSLWVSKLINHSLNWISLFKNIQLFSNTTIEFCSKTHNM